MSQHKAALKALAESEARYRAALSLGRMVTWETDLVARTRRWSDEAIALFGFAPEARVGQVGGSSDEFLSAIYPDDRHLVAKFHELADRQDLFDAEYRIIRPDGAIRWLSGYGKVLNRSASGKAQYLINIVADVSERKNAERALRDAEQKKDNFIATLAHELRNPLAPIRNALDVMRRIGSIDPQLNWCRDLIDRQIAQMTHLVEDLLDVSRITSGKLTLRTARLELATVVKQSVEIARTHIDSAGHELRLDVPTQAIVIEGDLTRLAQIFSNLLINAAKYTEGQGSILLQIEELHDAVIVRVRDTGIGIASEHLPNVFDMFGQVASALERSQGGLGIGLSLIKGLVEMHGGQISASSEGPGKGSEFVVRLPKPGPNYDPVEVPKSGTDDAALSTGYRILIADDSRDSADSLAMLLQMAGHEVHIAYDGETALQLAEQYRPQAILLDIGMPRLNGYQVGQRIRNESWGQSMVLIAQTGWGQARDREQSLAAGFDHHLVKPIDPIHVDSLLRSLLVKAK